MAHKGRAFKSCVFLRSRRHLFTKRSGPFTNGFTPAHIPPAGGRGANAWARSSPRLGRRRGPGLNKSQLAEILLRVRCEYRTHLRCENDLLWSKTQQEVTCLVCPPHSTQSA